DDVAAAVALTAPAVHLGVAWEDDAVARAVEASWGVPFFLQSIGRFAWQLRRGGTIRRADAETAVELAFADARGLYLARWELLTGAQRSFVSALARLGDEAAVAEVAAELGRRPAGLGRVRADLVARGVVETAGRGRVRFPLPGFATWVVERD
ncbi:MAG: ATP/GTP-binding protein, partial [Actinomycetes bacterium]|nr:ATP/GTP-binding protein [Actinomycetes bacterium]